MAAPVRSGLPNNAARGIKVTSSPLVEVIAVRMVFSTGFSAVGAHATKLAMLKASSVFFIVIGSKQGAREWVSNSVVFSSEKTGPEDMAGQVA